MKRWMIIVLAAVVVLAVAGGVLALCLRGDDTPTWQEQYDLGVRYLSEGRYEEAIIAFNAAIEIDPKREDAYLAMADVYMEQGNYEQAQAVLNQGLAAVENTDSIADKLTEVEEMAEQQAEPSPGPGPEPEPSPMPDGEPTVEELWQEQYDLGVLCASEEDYEGAVGAFKAAIEIDPAREEAYLALADVYIKLGDYGQAQLLLNGNLMILGDKETILEKLAEIEGLVSAATSRNLKVGDHLYFGSAAADEDPEIWQVIHMDGDYALIYNMYMSKGEFDSTIHTETRTLSLTQYHTYGSASWEYSDVRSWLNSNEETVTYQDIMFDYGNSGIATVPWNSDKIPSYSDPAGYLNEGRFTEREYWIIQPVTHQSLIPYTESKKESVWDTDFGKFPAEICQFYQEPYGVSVTTDRMFLLNGWEFREYVLENDLWGYRYPNGNNLAEFWLRDCVNTSFTSFYQYYGTNILTVSGGGASSSQADSKIGIRPACYIDVRYIDSMTGTGEFEDPYRLEISDDVVDREAEEYSVSVAIPEPTEVEVPNVVGMEQLEAIGVLQELGLQFQVWWNAGDNDSQLLYVMEQSVPAGDKVPVGTLIRLHITKTAPEGEPEPEPSPEPSETVPADLSRTERKDLSDGGYYMLSYGADGKLVRWIYYNAAGEVMVDYTAEAGHYLEINYNNCAVTEYEGNGRKVRYTDYYSGWKELNYVDEYDSAGNRVKRTYYKADGTVDRVETY